MVLGPIVLVFGVILFLIGWLGFAIKAFGESALWGLGVLFVPFVWIVYLVKFKEGRKYFKYVLLSAVLLIIGMIISQAYYMY